LVDGQQRFTTLTLLLHYLAQSLDKPYYYNRLISNVTNDYVFKINGFEFDKFKFVISDGCENEDDEDDEDQDDTPLTYKVAVDLINYFFKNNTIDYQDFFSWLLDHVSFSVVELLDENCEGSYFKDVNSKGKHISQVDMIKNTLFSKVEDKEQRDFLVKKWKKFDDGINNLIKKDYKPKTVRDGDIKEGIFRDVYKITKLDTDPVYKKINMYKDFVKKYNTFEEILVLIEKCIMYNECILKYIYSEEDIYRLPTLFFRVRKLKSFISTIMYAKEKNYSVDICLEILSRITLFTHTGIKQLYDAKLDAFHKCIRDGKDVILWYNNLIDTLTVHDLTRDLYYQKNSNARVKSALVFMEAKMYNKANYLETICDKDLFKSFNIEHIYPKHDDTDANKWFNKFGNLTLLKNGKNSSIKDEMEKKSPAYQDVIDGNILSRILVTNDPNKYVSLRVNNKYLEKLTPYSVEEIIDWDETKSIKRNNEMALLFKEMLKM